MIQMKIAFTHMIQDSQEYGSDDEHVISRVFFDITSGAKEFRGLYVNVKQTLGSSFETGPLEVSSPVGYAGPFNYQAFRDAVERYYRLNVGTQGLGIRLPTRGHARMRNVQHVRPFSAEFETEAENKAW